MALRGVNTQSSQQVVTIIELNRVWDWDGYQNNFPNNVQTNGDIEQRDRLSAGGDNKWNQVATWAVQANGLNEPLGGTSIGQYSTPNATGFSRDKRLSIPEVHYKCM